MIRIFMIGYSTNKGGVEAYISNLNENMDHDKFEVIYSMPEMEIDGKTWIRPDNRHNYLKYRTFWHKFFKCNHFEVVYYNACDIVSIDMLKFAKKAGVPTRIIHSHNTGVQQSITRKMSLFHRYTEKQNRKNLNKYATHLFACSKVAGDWMFDGRPFLIIKNGIQLSAYKYNNVFRDAHREELGIKNTFLVGCIGRIDPQKNPLFSLEIFAEVLKAKPDSHMVFIGDGELKKELHKAIEKRKIGANVHVLGARNDVNEWLSAIDCLVMPSLFEGLPFVLVEAQAAGLQCIVSSNVSEESNITGLVEYVDLNTDKKIWAERIVSVDAANRLDFTNKLVDAGYDIKSAARIVAEIIKEHK